MDNTNFVKELLELCDKYGYVDFYCDDDGMEISINNVLVAKEIHSSDSLRNLVGKEKT